MSTPKSSTQKLSPLVDSLISRYEPSDGDGSSGGGTGAGGGIDGIVVNDANGLCLVSKGMTTANTPISTSNNGNKSTGVYTSLTRLASKLAPHQQKLQQQQQEQLLHNDSTEGQTTPTSTSSQQHSAAAVVSAPLITIETEGPSSSSSSSSSILIKEYDNKYTVAVRVTSNDDDTAVVKN